LIIITEANDPLPQANCFSRYIFYKISKHNFNLSVQYLLAKKTNKPKSKKEEKTDFPEPLKYSYGPSVMNSDFTVPGTSGCCEQAVGLQSSRWHSLPHQLSTSRLLLEGLTRNNSWQKGSSPV